MGPKKSATRHSPGAASLRSAGAAVWLPVAAALAATLGWWLLPLKLVSEWVTEAGPVENATAVLYGVAMIAIAFATRFGPAWKTTAALLIFVAGLCARELDLHRTAANDSVLRVSYYFGNAPLQTRLLALTAVALFVAALGYLSVRYGATLLRSLKQTDPLAVTVLVFLMTGIIAKAFDRGVGMLMEDFAVVLPVSVAVWAQAVEETLEACLPVLIVLGARQWHTASSESRYVTRP